MVSAPLSSTALHILTSVPPPKRSFLPRNSCSIVPHRISSSSSRSRKLSSYSASTSYLSSGQIGSVRCRVNGEGSQPTFDDRRVYRGVYGPWTVDPSDIREVARFNEVPLGRLLECPCDPEPTLALLLPPSLTLSTAASATDAFCRSLCRRSSGLTLSLSSRIGLMASQEAVAFFRRRSVCSSSTCQGTRLQVPPPPMDALWNFRSFRYYSSQLLPLLSFAPPLLS
ncbi:hypothetical protein BHE74_00046611 [Ensete ventricosum]|nr:hypothetical protein BHE74_00046611 [Ensete ventricosum]